MEPDSTKRFTNRVEDYTRYRPDYPEAFLDLLEPPRRIAELGAGTGILTEQLLERGHHVYAVEPNPAMREACQRRLGACPRLTLSGGTGEATGLEHRSVESIVAAQSFHWFDADRARTDASSGAPGPRSASPTTRTSTPRAWPVGSAPAATYPPPASPASRP
ncbi:MAG TPA: class I SAM-dependent methyltransferase [Myxococcota bacterium]|nr:class I SAM-dependent methyltransferase [Myxococcota bacterium]